jgi:hypothetical protein
VYGSVRFITLYNNMSRITRGVICILCCRFILIITRYRQHTQLEFGKLFPKWGFQGLLGRWVGVAGRHIGALGTVNLSPGG